MAQESRASQISAMRRDYMQRGLDESDLDPNPYRQFDLWFNEAVNSGVVAEPNAMVLGTVSPEGQPRGRFVLLKGFDEQGFVFFTNYQSAKGRALALNPRASLTFGWIELERQVCIEGIVTRTSRDKVETYFKSRPHGSQLGALVSPQSEVIPDRAFLQTRLEQATQQFPNEVPVPPEWGGYVLTPDRLEFWQGRTNRLHDRLRYRKEATAWLIERLAA